MKSLENSRNKGLSVLETTNITKTYNGLIFAFYTHSKGT